MVAVGFDIYGNTVYRDEDGVLYGYDPTTGNYYISSVYTGNSGGGRVTPGLPAPTYPISGGGGVIQPGGSWLNDLLNTFLGYTALTQHGSIAAGGAINQQQYPQYPQSYNPYGTPITQQGGGIAQQAGSTLGSFVQKNAVVLLIAGGIFVLYKSGRK